MDAAVAMREPAARALRSGAAGTRRGDRMRATILGALRELLDEQPIGDISVTALTRRARITRPAFYFYFDTKFAALAALQNERAVNAAQIGRRLQRRRPDESEVDLIERIITAICAVLVNADPVWSACRAARYLAAEIETAVSNAENAVVAALLEIVAKEARHGARPITPDLPALIRTLTATTAMIGWRDPHHGAAADFERSRGAIKAMWLHALWPNLARPSTFRS